MRTALEKFETHMVANIISLGAIYELMGENIIDKDIMIRSITERVPAHTVQRTRMHLKKVLN